MLNLFFLLSITTWKKWKWSRVWLFVTPWIVAWQAPLSMGILQARNLVGVAIPFFRGFFRSRDGTQVSCIAGRFFTIWATRGGSESWESLLKYRLLGPTNRVSGSGVRPENLHLFKVPGWSDCCWFNNHIWIRMEVGRKRDARWDHWFRGWAEDKQCVEMPGWSSEGNGEWTQERELLAE